MSIFFFLGFCTVPGTMELFYLWLLGIFIPNSKNQGSLSFSNSSKLVSLLLYQKSKVFSALYETCILYSCFVDKEAEALKGIASSSRSLGER